MTIRERNRAWLKRKWKEFLKRMENKNAEQQKRNSVRQDY